METNISQGYKYISPDTRKHGLRLFEQIKIIVADIAGRAIPDYVEADYVEADYVEADYA